ncbi:hypothetical protein ACVWYG_003757 [Pedobacter sp. UYEF25]
MKNYLKIFCVALLLCSGCKKHDRLLESTALSTQKINNLELAEVKYFISTLENNDSISKAIKLIDWNRVQKKIKNGNVVWEFYLPGQPTYDGYKQGFRRLIIFKNNKSNIIEGKFQEIIPESIYLQKLAFEHQNFYGRIFEYNLKYKLLGGVLLSDGHQIGDIKTITEQERISLANRNLQQFEKWPADRGRQMFARVVQSCTWIYTTYIDSEGDFTISGQKICSVYSYELNYIPDFNNMLGDEYSSGGGGGGGSGGSPGGSKNGNAKSPKNVIPAPSNLPGEDKGRVDPKKMMECFANITDLAAKCIVKVYVVEPFPGTSFNVGPNSFGHVAISLTKTSGSTSITQTIGFYPTGVGVQKLSSNSQILDNGDLTYNISATYAVSANNFQKVINYLSNPPSRYDFTDYNCSAFVYGAGLAGNVPIPDPTTQIGLSGPGGVGISKTPAGMAAALRDQKAKNPNTGVNENGGRIPPSKGECNKQLL